MVLEQYAPHSLDEEDPAPPVLLREEEMGRGLEPGTEGTRGQVCHAAAPEDLPVAAGDGECEVKRACQPARPLPAGYQYGTGEPARLQRR